jgi:hypothetical protein
VLSACKTILGGLWDCLRLSLEGGVSIAPPEVCPATISRSLARHVPIGADIAHSTVGLKGASQVTCGR